MLVERALLEPRAAPLEVVPQRAPGSRYIDWLIPGLIGLNLLGAGLWGIGFNLVQMRLRNTLRRLMVTPMRRSEYLFAFMLSRLVLVVPEAAVIVGFGHFVFGVPVRGEALPLLLLLVVLSAMAFMSLGLLVGSRARSVEVVSGLMNLVMLPMWLLSGSFFSSERFPEVMQPLVRALPLTQVNDGLREILSHGGGIGAAAGSLAYLVVFTVCCFGLAIRLFRWA
jgi:ABC transporter DrrB family efflux protein